MFEQLVSTHDYAIIDQFTNELICWLCTCGGFAWLSDEDGAIPETLMGFESTHDKATRNAIAERIGTDCYRVASL